MLISRDQNLTLQTPQPPCITFLSGTESQSDKIRTRLGFQSQIVALLKPTGPCFPQLLRLNKGNLEITLVSLQFQADCGGGSRKRSGKKILASDKLMHVMVFFLGR